MVLLSDGRALDDWTDERNVHRMSISILGGLEVERAAVRRADPIESPQPRRLKDDHRTVPLLLLPRRRRRQKQPHWWPNENVS